MITLLLLPYLLINRADSNLAMNNGFTPLMIASLIGHDDVIQLLLERNIQIKTQNKEEFTASCQQEWSIIGHFYLT